MTRIAGYLPVSAIRREGAMPATYADPLDWSVGQNCDAAMRNGGVCSKVVGHKSRHRSYWALASARCKRRSH
jgi:hypothetical protein